MSTRVTRGITPWKPCSKELARKSGKQRMPRRRVPSRGERIGCEEIPPGVFANHSPAQSRDISAIDHFVIYFVRSCRALYGGFDESKSRHNRALFGPTCPRRNQHGRRTQEVYRDVEIDLRGFQGPSHRRRRVSLGKDSIRKAFV